MAGREFSIVHCDIRESVAYRNLSSSNVKEVYWCAHCSRSNTPSGIFRYTISTWAEDAQLPTSIVSEAKKELAQKDFISYEDETERVRLVRWFRNHAPQNPKHARSLIKEFERESRFGQLHTKQLAEFTVALAQGITTWNADTADFLTMQKSICRLVRVRDTDTQGALMNAITIELSQAALSARNQVQSLLPNLMLQEATPRNVQGDTVSIQKNESREDNYKEQNKKSVAVEFEEPSVAANDPDCGNVVRSEKAMNVTKLSRLAQEAIGAKRF